MILEKNKLIQETTIGRVMTCMDSFILFSLVLLDMNTREMSVL